MRDRALSAPGYTALLRLLNPQELLCDHTFGGSHFHNRTVPVEYWARQCINEKDPLARALIVLVLLGVSGASHNWRLIGSAGLAAGEDRLGLALVAVGVVGLDRAGEGQ